MQKRLLVPFLCPAWLHMGWACSFKWCIIHVPYCWLACNVYQSCVEAVSSTGGWGIAAGLDRPPAHDTFHGPSPPYADQFWPSWLCNESLTLNTVTQTTPRGSRIPPSGWLACNTFLSFQYPRPSAHPITIPSITLMFRVGMRSLRMVCLSPIGLEYKLISGSINIHHLASWNNGIPWITIKLSSVCGFFVGQQLANYNLI